MRGSARLFWHSPFRHSPRRRTMATAAAPAPAQPVSDRSTSRGPGAIHRGPPLGGLAVAFTGLFLASQVILGMMAVGTFPNPYEAPETAQVYFGANADILR